MSTKYGIRVLQKGSGVIATAEIFDLTLATTMFCAFAAEMDISIPTRGWFEVRENLANLNPLREENHDGSSVVEAYAIRL